MRLTAGTSILAASTRPPLAMGTAGLTPGTPPAPVERRSLRPGTGNPAAPPVSAEFAQWPRTLHEPAIAATDRAGFSDMFSDPGLPGWAAADGVYSINLRDGRVLWTFGDTMVNTVDPTTGAVVRNGTFVRNSAVLQDGTMATMLTGGTQAAPSDFLLPASPDDWYWPGHGVVDGRPAGAPLVLFMGRYTKVEGQQGWGFRWSGTDLWTMDSSTLARGKRVELAVPKDRTVTWGMYVLEDGPRTYIYGMEAGEKPTDRWAVVARAPRGAVADQSRWEYWNGAAWTPDIDRTARVSDEVSNQYSVIRTKTGYAMVSQAPYFDMSLLTRTAPTPQGPWTPWRVVDPGPVKGPNQISYNATSHPSFNAGGRLLVGWSMNLNDGTLPTPPQNPFYQPRFRSIPLSAFEHRTQGVKWWTKSPYR